MRANFACRTLNLPACQPACHAARRKDGRKEEDTTKIDDYILIIRTGFISACPSRSCRSRRSHQHTTYEHSHKHTYTHTHPCIAANSNTSWVCMCAHYCCRPCRSRLCMLSSASETALVAWPAQTHLHTHTSTHSLEHEKSANMSWALELPSDSKNECINNWSKINLQTKRFRYTQLNN